MTSSPDVVAEDGLARRWDRPMGALGLVFVLVVLGQSLAEDAALVAALTVAGWLLWLVFVAEFAVRAWVAPDRRQFWRRNWWQVVFLAVPFLRFARALSLLRLARAGGVVSAAVRGSRSAGRLLSGRVATLSVVTGIVVLATSQLLYLLGHYDAYADALHDSALATITGEPLTAEGGLPQLLDVLLAAYSVGVFATLAAALGAYFLRGPAADAAAPDGPGTAAPSRTPPTSG